MMANVKQCRLCLHKGVIDIRIDRSGDVMKKVNSALTFKFEIKDELSPLLCRECFKQVTDIYTFQMQCLRQEFQNRKKARLETPEVKVSNYSTDINETNTAPLQQRLSDSGLQVMRQNMKKLNDKIATMTQDKVLMQDKIQALEKENDELKRAVMQHTLTLPDITKNISSLLSRMEQQFEAMNTRVINDSYVDTRTASPLRANSTARVVQRAKRPRLREEDDSPNMDTSSIVEDDDNLLLTGATTISTTIWDDESYFNSRYFTVLVPRRPII